MAGSDCLPTVHEWESPDYEPSLPVSEKSNPLTCDIDRASANHIVRMLHASDTQMFQEETRATYQRLLSEQVVETLMEVAKNVELILKDPRDSLVVLSGCGTSGRLAFLITVKAVLKCDFAHCTAGIRKQTIVCLRDVQELKPVL